MKTAFEWVYTPHAAPARPVSTEPSAAGLENRIEQAFAAASDTTGTSFEYLLKTAQRESSLNTNANARTSSAAGLFQFIESTWLETMKDAGGAVGLGRYADAIERGANGRYSVADPALRKEILDLRYDPDIASMMAGALTRRNGAYLAERLGREANAGELYIAHFLGARGAASLIGLAEKAPGTTAADVFPRQAAANKSIFYDGRSARTVEEVYGELVRLHGGTAPALATPVMTAAAPAAADDPFATTDGEGDGAALGYADPGDRVQAGWTAADAETAFEGLFRTDQPAARVNGAAAFFSAFTRAPGLFDVAAAADTADLGATAPDGLSLSTPGPSAFEASERQKRKGPLDLTRFLNIKS